MPQRSRITNTVNDCLALLQYLDKHPEGTQTYTSLAKDTGVPRHTLFRLISQARKDEHGSVLCRTAYRYRFDFEIHRNGAKRIISAVYRGYGDWVGE